MSGLDIHVALDPARSVVVEACAGSGKTWLLVSRLVRLLLAGVRPGQILAITFTRKAAREIEERLRDALALLASADDDIVLTYLAQRGLDEAAARASLPRARSLFEDYLRADPPLTIGTFHAWFARLLSAAPLDSPLSRRQLDESANNLFDEAWTGLSAACANNVEGEVAQSLLWLFAEFGAFNTRRLLRKFLARQAEWQMWRAMHGSIADVLGTLPELLGVRENPPHECLTHTAMHALLDRLAPALEMGSQTTKDKAAQLRAALAHDDNGQAALLLADVLLTQKDEPRKLTAAGTKKQLSADDFARFEADLACAQEEAIAFREALLSQRILQTNMHGLRVGDALLERLQELKRARRAMDFNDLEIEVDRLLDDPATGAFVMARLDARYRHILLDEFQDTNPMQWRVLRAWFDAYGEGNEAPRVFMVGDPKQSIYRFRRAEPRLFDAARTYFCTHLAAVEQATDHTRRNAGAVVQAVNAVFAERDGFRPQTTERANWPGWVEVLPLVERSAEPAPLPEERDGRDPLSDPVEAEEDDRRAQEAALLVERLQGMFGRVAVRNADDSERPLAYDDVLILTRSTKQLAPYEAALRAAGIPFISPGRGGLLGTLEAQDVLALLRFLADPADALSLAHVLRCPVFDLSDECLLEIFSRDADAWTTLCALANNGHAILIPVRESLAGWIDLAHHLPTHDALDAIFNASDWLVRYKRRVPEAMWPGVHANLDALIELTLSVDAGRYPSLSRLVDELRRMSGGDEDAPDEGLIALDDDVGSDPEVCGRVRIMTIHGAKGLEAPVVWLINAHGKKRPLDGYDVIIDWPADSAQPEHFSLIATQKERGRAREILAQTDEAAEAREQLNLLYVAMTRAQQVFIVSGIALQRGENIESHHALLQAALEPLGGCIGQGLPEMQVSQAATTSCIVPPKPKAEHLHIGRRRKSEAMSAGQQFGIQLHSWLQHATEGAPKPDVPGEVQRAAERILARPSLAGLFDAKNILRGGNEVSFAIQGGGIGRIDRWVETRDALWVLDYKSGAVSGAPMAQYRAQLVSYRQALLPFAKGKPIRALLVFTDGSDVEIAFDSEDNIDN
ncbi:MAG: ATP-dependent exonuclease beta subunit, helicase and exonuclease [Rhodocyclales bacterium]|nr:ATP-dependent exonuclease beta subunit, helicase and exonuclease [Rhodocyclales bacterium]